MRYLVDGYNVMYAGGLLGKKFAPHEFRKVRARFLNDLANALGPIDAGETTVVFDASTAPDDVERKARTKGLTILYAVDEDSADELIEQLIASHPNPKTLTVVSTDRRIRQAASRRRAVSLTADAFWVSLDTKRERKARPQTPPKPPPPPAQSLSDAESKFWQREFAEIDQDPATHEALGTFPPMLTDAEIAEIEREIDREKG